MHSKAKGTVGELAVAQQLIEQGYPVFKELGDLSKIDLVTFINSKCVRIQVKCQKEVNGTIGLCLYKCGPNNLKFKYTPKDADVFAIYNLSKNMICYVGWRQLISITNTFTIRFETAKSGCVDSNLAKDFISIQNAI